MVKYIEYKQSLRQDRIRNNLNGHISAYFFSEIYRMIYRYRRCKLFEDRSFLYRIPHLLSRILYNHTCKKLGCDIPSHTTIGPGLCIKHPNGIVINSSCVIGSNFTIKSGAVIGNKHSGGKVPKIGDDVNVGVHAIVIGDVTIGNGASIGAGAIVTHSVPDNAIVINEAAHILKIIE